MTAPVRLCPDSMLGYEREVWRPEPGTGLSFDDRYRLAHLPLIAPHHPLAIAATPGLPYRSGRHPPSVSLVIEIDADALEPSPDFVALSRQISASSFSAKICWPLLERRRHRLHATVAGSLSDVDVSRLTDPAGRAILGSLGPVRAELRGLFAGEINRGRLYLRLYPEERGGRPALAAVHDLLGRLPSDLFLVGLYNLREELDTAEAVVLSQLIATWWPRAVLRFDIGHLALLRSSDDLVLDSEIMAPVIPLTSHRSSS